MHGHLVDHEPGVGDLLHHLEADDAAVFGELHTVEHAAANEPEVAVHVPDLQAEQPLHRVVVDAADDNPMQRIGPADLIAVHEIHARPHVRPEQLDFRWVVLSVAVGVEDQVLAGLAKPGPECAAVAAVSIVIDDADFRIRACELVRNLRRRVRAPVVDHQDLEVRRELPGAPPRGNHQAGDRAAVVVGGKEDAEADRPGHRAWVHSGAVTLLRGAAAAKALMRAPRTRLRSAPRHAASRIPESRASAPVVPATGRGSAGRSRRPGRRPGRQRRAPAPDGR